ncbi:MAG: ISAs1 family transposase [Aureispira sp.]|nr:ISAs1 family transposase [Aureispira sp.]
MEENPLQKIDSYFAGLKDFRVNRTKYYPLPEIIFLAISAVISGSESWEEVADFGADKLSWLRKYYPYTAGTPSHDTLNRVLSKINQEDFNECFINWVSAISELPSGSLINLDGKTIKGSKDAGKKTVHIVSAWCSEVSMCLGQVKTAEKSNEITAIPKLLDLLELEGCVISIDAMGCQKDIATQIKKKKANYILGLKGNQKNLLKSVECSFEQLEPDNEDVWVDKDHGRLEIRTCRVIHDLDLIPMAGDWKDLQSLVQIECSRELLATGKVEQNTRYYVASLKTDAKHFNRLVRGHWGIENQLHWSLDVLFREDLSRKRQGEAAENFALIRKIVLNLLNQEKTKISKNRKRLKAARSDKYREKILQI